MSVVIYKDYKVYCKNAALAKQLARRRAGALIIPADQLPNRKAGYKMIMDREQLSDFVREIELVRDEALNKLTEDQKGIAEEWQDYIYSSIDEIIDDYPTEIMSSELLENIKNLESYVKAEINEYIARAK